MPWTSKITMPATFTQLRFYAQVKHIPPCFWSISQQKFGVVAVLKSKPNAVQH
jgi:hypothetical protein